MKKIPLWTKYCVLFVFGILITMSIVLVSVTFITYSDKKEILKQDMDNMSNLIEAELSNKLTSIEERFGGMELAYQIYLLQQNMRETRNAQELSELLGNLCGESGEILALFYVSSQGECYSAGGNIGGLNRRLSLVEHGKEKQIQYGKNNVWFYDQTMNGDHAFVLYKDIIFVDENYKEHFCGNILIYIDEEDVTEYFLKEIQEGIEIAYIDSNGVIALSNNQDLLGKSKDSYLNLYNDKSGKNTSYILKELKSEICGWSRVLVISMEIIALQTTEMLKIIAMISAICCVAMVIIMYFVTKILGRPIAELLGLITVSPYGEISLPDMADKNDVQQIKSVFDKVTFLLTKQIDLNYQKELELQTAILESYENQMNPHFIFNTLQTIQMLNVIGKKAELNEVVTCLGNMLRFNLQKENEVTLGHEIEIITDYFKILKYRFGDDFDYKIFVDPQLYNCRVLKFLLQPFVENSMKHGFVKKGEGCWEIAVAAYQYEEEIAVVIKDNGCGIKRERLSEIKQSLTDNTKGLIGIGISNVNSRIKHAYGDKYGVDLFSVHGTQVLIHLPYVKIGDYKNV